MLAKNGEERRDARGGVRSVVVHELREGPKISPVILVIVAVDSEILFEGLIDAFSLSVGLRMMSGGMVHANAKQFGEGVEKLGDEFSTTVGGEVRQSTVFGEHMDEEDSCKLLGGEFSGTRNEHALLGETIHNDEYGVAVGDREFLDEVHGDGVPWSGCHRKRLECSIGFVTSGFVASASCT